MSRFFHLIICALFGGLFSLAPSPAVSGSITELLNTKSCPECDLSGVDLSGADLVGSDLTGANLRGANLNGTQLAAASLGGANLQGADLTGAELSRADARGANFRASDLSNTKLTDTDFRGANLSGADLRFSRLSATDFRGAVLENADMRNAVVESWRDRDALFCQTIDPAGQELNRDCERIAELRALTKEGFGGGRDLLRGSVPGRPPINPGDGEAALTEYLDRKPWPRANTDEGILQIQTLLRTLGYDPGPSDGYWGRKTNEALNAFLVERDLEPASSPSDEHIGALRDEIAKRGWSTLPKMDWEWRATSVKVGPLAVAGETQTIPAIPDFGLNMLTIDVNCGDLIGTQDPTAPVRRYTGCRIGSVPVADEQGVGTETIDKTLSAALFAKEAGLKINLKIIIALDGDNAGPIGLTTDEFFAGDGMFYPGYSLIGPRIAAYAEALGADILTVGAEFGNFNPSIETDPRWSGTLSEMRTKFSGLLKYDFNFTNGDDPFERTGPNDLMSRVDVLGINVFPTQILGTQTDYTAEEVALAYERARNRASGENYMESLRRFVSLYDKPTVLSEMSFPTWEGSANFAFRGTCDLGNFGKSDWPFTLGPLRPKVTSDEAGRILAEAYLLVFADEPWVTGVDYLYWTTGTYYQTFRGEQLSNPAEWVDCASLLFEKPNGIKEMVRDAHSSRQQYER